MLSHLEPYTDGRGVTVELESHLPVSECCACQTVMVRRKLIESSPRLVRLYQAGFVGCLGGTNDNDRPYCRSCWHSIAPAEAMMPLSLFGRQMFSDTGYKADSAEAEAWRENAVRVLEEGSN